MNKTPFLTEKKIYLLLCFISLIAFAFLIWLIYVKPISTDQYLFVSYLPALNASLNFLTSVFLIFGFVLIKKGYVDAHRKFMGMATLTSAIFLVSYILYHHFHGDSKFHGTGPIKFIYFFILISHILLSAIQVPLILITLYLALARKVEKHKKIAKITFPIWLYVSITGVLIFAFLQIF